MTRCIYSIIRNDEGQNILYIRDEDVGMSVTNDAENVVAELFENGLLNNGKRLFYYDSEGQLDEILHEEGKFTGFAPGN